MTETTYICPACGLNSTGKSSDPIPVCCGTEMIPAPLPVCVIPVSAESSRTDGADCPCADGTTPRKS